MEKRSVMVPSAMATGGDDGTVFLDGKPSTSVPSRVLGCCAAKGCASASCQPQFCPSEPRCGAPNPPGKKKGKKWRAQAAQVAFNFQSFAYAGLGNRRGRSERRETLIKLLLHTSHCFAIPMPQRAAASDSP